MSQVMFLKQGKIRFRLTVQNFFRQTCKKLYVEKALKCQQSLEHLSQETSTKKKMFLVERKHVLNDKTLYLHVSSVENAC